MRFYISTFVTSVIHFPCSVGCICFVPTFVLHSSFLASGELFLNRLKAGPFLLCSFVFMLLILNDSVQDWESFLSIFHFWLLFFIVRIFVSVREVVAMFQNNECAVAMFRW